MNFGEITIASGQTYTNSSGNYILLVSWGNAFTINDPNGNAASGSIAAYVATNSLVLIPPGWKMVAGANAVFAQGLFLTPVELVGAVVGGYTGNAPT